MNPARIETVEKDALVYLTASHFSRAGGAAHCFTTRRGGVSGGELSSLNLGLSRGDARENVVENYEILCSALGLDCRRVVFSRQTHSDHVILADEKDAGCGLFKAAGFEADAYITQTLGLVLTVFTADCTPILLYDPVSRAAGAVHAGWRGTANGILGKTVGLMKSAFGCKPENILAAIGPAIGACCFETDSDVPQAMHARFGTRADEFIQAFGDKWRVDIKALNRLHLLDAGVLPENIVVSELCTVCEPALFWSHRRNGAQRGSQAAMIALC